MKNHGTLKEQVKKQGHKKGKKQNGTEEKRREEK